MYAAPEPYHIFVGTRTVSKGEDARQQIQSEVSSPSSPSSTLDVVQVDVTSDASLEAAIAYIADQTTTTTTTTTTTSPGGRLDVLIHNAGASFDGALAQGTLSARAAFNASWDTNVSGTHVLTHLAVPLLLRSADPRLLFVTSGTSSLWETEPTNWVGADGHVNEVMRAAMARINSAPAKGWPKEEKQKQQQPMNPITSYRTTKTGLNMLMREWARILREDGVKVWAISPGFLATGLGGVGKEALLKMGAKDPSVGGHFIREVVEGKRDEDMGKVIRNEMIQPW